MTLLFQSMSYILNQQQHNPKHVDDKDDNDDNTPITTITQYTSPIIMCNENKENNGQMTMLLEYMVEALRKSVLVTCSSSVDDNKTPQDLTTSFDISCPTHVRHISHVTFDCFNGFLGLPDELLPQLPPKVPSASASVFGVSPQSMQCCIDERGNSVPTLLIMLQKQLYAQGGLKAEGIFRINAENSQEECVRNQLNNGVVPRHIDVHCLAGLIKAWFRELPKGVLDCLPPEQVMQCNTEDECSRLVKLLPTTESGLLKWAINLMADVVQNEHYNKMNARNIAMVFAPNMTQMADPLTALIHAVQVMNLLKTLIERTLRSREESPEKSTKNTRSSTSFGELISQEDEKYSAFEQSRSREYNSDAGKQYSCVSVGASLTYEGGESDGILDKLNLRKGAKMLRRRPIFQLSKLTRKNSRTLICTK